MREAICIHIGQAGLRSLVHGCCEYVASVAVEARIAC